VIEAVDEFLEQQETDWYRKGLPKLEERWTKCIEIRDNDFLALFFLYEAGNFWDNPS